MKTFDFVIVGSGLTGATMARLLTDLDHRVLVLERRDHIGGNVADQLHSSGIRVGLYGPHYFRTSSDALWSFVNRFARFHPFEAEVRSRVRGRLENWPVGAGYIRRTVGKDWSPEFRGVPRNFEEAALSMMPRSIYEDFVRGYTEKQWGAPATTLSAALAGRFDVREDDDPRLTPTRKHQGVPADGYTALVENMLSGIPYELNCDYLRMRTVFKARKALIFTGSIDAYFGFRFGRLSYRAQKRSTDYHADADFMQPCVQVNEPDPAVSHIRTIEWKHLLPEAERRRVRGTVLTRETPCSVASVEETPEYPFPDAANKTLYQRYRALAAQEPTTLICGRLGEYRYYDMDQAIARAQTLVRQLLETQPWAAKRPSQLIPAGA
ncbi:MAG: UDP-galactopyranose mutase [Planctomycetota bacterium]|nr:MAG: UDP-galactopyranose mutase [Planctomycetota bacterium]